jgi:flagellar M-ring protein FliF
MAIQNPSSFDALLGRISGSRQMLIIAVGIGVTALVFGVSRWATAPDMVPLYADVPIEAVGTMTDKLTEAGIVYELDRAGNTIRVSSTDLPRARVTLARDQIAGGGRPGLELFDKPTWGMTDFTQKVNYRRALEGELERTIGNMRDVEKVQVHLAIEEEQVFKKNERPSKASVTLKMKGGETPRPETVRGIASLVASSVGGLDPQHVTIVDERGQALTMEGDGTITGLSSRQLAVQREVETHLEQKAAALLSNLVGNGNARVQVSAALNFDKIERTTQAIDPARQALVTEQRAEVTPSSPQQGAGYATTATSFENTRSVETYSGAIGSLKKITVAVLVADKVERTGTDSATTIPPTIIPRTPEELTRIELLVRNALGVDSTRGDMISVVSAPFDMPAMVSNASDTLPTPTIVTRLMSNPKPIVSIVAIVGLLIMGLVTLKALKQKPAATSAARPAALPPAQAYPELAAANQMSMAMSMQQPEQYIEERRPVVLPPLATSAEREQAIATVEQRPDAAIRVARGWIRS